MKRYFLQILGVALALSPLVGQTDASNSDGNGEYLSITSAYSNPDDRLLTEAKTANYNDVAVSMEADEPVDADAYFVYPNPTNGVVQLKLTGKITVYVYTLSAQCVQKSFMPPGEKTLDLSSLPAGLDHVMAKSDEDYYSGKLIIN